MRSNYLPTRPCMHFACTEGFQSPCCDMFLSTVIPTDEVHSVGFLPRVARIQGPNFV